MLTVLVRWIIVLHLIGLAACQSNHQDKNKNTVAEILLSQEIACQEKLLKAQNARIYQTGFESMVDFSGFYSVPQNYQNAVTWDLETKTVYSGSSAAKGWIYAAGSYS